MIKIKRAKKKEWIKKKKPLYERLLKSQIEKR
jgi:hypothetical protein